MPTKKYILKENQVFNESNLMTLPIFSLSKKRVGYKEYSWTRDGKEVKLTIKAPDATGIPTVRELDVLLGLLSLAKKEMPGYLEIDNENKVLGIPKVINFTYRSLAKEMGLKGFGKKTKTRLKDSLQSLIESTIYNTLAFRDQTMGKYVVGFDGQESCHILENLRDYSITRQKLMDEKMLSPKEIQEYQSVEINNFFFKNLCSNYLKVFDYDIYKKLSKGLSKKLYLLLSQWSHGGEKYITISVLCAYLGVIIETKDDEYAFYKSLKETLRELKESRFIEDYIIKRDVGVTFIFNSTQFRKEMLYDKYSNEFEIVARLREVGITYDEISKYCTEENMKYVAAMLRYVDRQHKKGKVKDICRYVRTGLMTKEYDVDEYKS